MISFRFVVFFLKHAQIYKYDRLYFAVKFILNPLAKQSILNIYLLKTFRLKYNPLRLFTRMNVVGGAIRIL